MHGLIVDKNMVFPAAAGEEGTSVIYKGVQFSVMATAEPDVWEWRLLSGALVLTRLPPLPRRR